MPARTQAELVEEDQGFKSKEVTRRITLPGLKTLHNKPTKEIAEVLALAIKSEPNVIEIRYRVGEFIELTSIQA
jgi:hypothetical protein